MKHHAPDVEMSAHSGDASTIDRGPAAAVWGFTALHVFCFAASFPPLDLWPLIVFAPPALALAALRASSSRQILLATMVMGFVQWLWLNRWMTNVTAPGYPLLGVYMSVYPAMFALSLRGAARAPRLRRIPMSVLVPLLWTAFEYLRGSVICDGYPWFLLAHPLIHAPAVVQGADLFGVYFVGFLVAMAGGAIVDLWPSFRTPRSRMAVVLVLAIFAANIGYGAWRLSQRDTLHPGPTILAIQTNLPQDNKTAWKPDDQVRDVGSFIDQTVAAIRELRAGGLSDDGVDLVVWPETMVPGFGLEPQALTFAREGEYFPGDLFAGWLQQLHGLIGAPLLIGSPAYLDLRVEGEKFRWDRQYNSAYLVDGAPPYQRYDKYFLTPFGETMPYISKWKWLERQLIHIGVGADLSFDLDSNPDLVRIRVPVAAGGQWGAGVVESGWFTFVTPICFEDTVPHVCRRMVYERGTKQADAIINLSNDGWFAGFDSDRQLHAQTARFRCIENRVPMIRCANTGFTVSIDSCGRLVGAVGGEHYGVCRVPGHLLARVTLDRRSTVYGGVGDLFPWFCVAMMVLVVVGSIKRSGKDQVK